LKKFLLVLLLFPFLMMGAADLPGETVKAGEGPPSHPEAFPITVDFHCLRDFGFHIGDEIPLTVTLEVRGGVILDLVNLPQKNDAHGPFEVRDMRVRKRNEHGRTVYTVLYQLQCFEPVMAVNKVNFPPLHIAYATQEDWDPGESKYHYRDLFSQPFEILFSRTATYFGSMKEMKGPILDRKAVVMWKGAILAGALLVLPALMTWPWSLIRKRQKMSQAQSCPTARDRALKALQEARENCFNYDDHRKRLYFEVNAILRGFLKEVFALTTANRPALEIIDPLKDHPDYEELMDLVVRINRVIYEGNPPVDVESIVRTFCGLLQKLDGTKPPGGSDVQAG
jgi:hypothetical protein